MSCDTRAVCHQAQPESKGVQTVKQIYMARYIGQAPTAKYTGVFVSCCVRISDHVRTVSGVCVQFYLRIQLYKHCRCLCVYVSVCLKFFQKCHRNIYLAQVGAG